MSMFRRPKKLDGQLDDLTLEPDSPVSANTHGQGRSPPPPPQAQFPNLPPVPPLPPGPLQYPPLPGPPPTGPPTGLGLNIQSYYESQPLPPVPPDMPTGPPPPLPLDSSVYGIGQGPGPGSAPSSPRLARIMSGTSGPREKTPPQQSQGQSQGYSQNQGPNQAQPQSHGQRVTPPQPASPLSPSMGVPSPSLRGSVDDISQLIHLDLSASQSTVQMISSTGRLPRWLQRCTSLQYLSCKGLGLTVVDEWLSHKLLALKVLRLNDNRITQWPEHLGRLVAYGQIQVIDLEGNPCLTSLLRKSLGFTLMYAQAAGRPFDDATVKKLSKKQDKNGMNVGLTDDLLQTIFARPTPAVAGVAAAALPPPKAPTRKASSGVSLFKKKKKTDTHDALTSLEPKPALASKQSTLELVPAPSPRGTESSLVGATNAKETARIDPVDLEKTALVVQVLTDVYELCTRICPLTSPEYLSSGLAIYTGLATPGTNSVPGSGSGSSSGPSSRPAAGSISSGTSGTANPIISTIHQSTTSDSPKIAAAPFHGSSLQAAPMSSAQAQAQAQAHGLTTTSSLNTLSIEMSHTVDVLAEFVRKERLFVSYMEEFITVYLDSSRPAKKVAPCFRYHQPIFSLHTSTLLGLLEASVERMMQGDSDEDVLDILSSRIVGLMDEFQCYIDYAADLESSKRTVKDLAKIKRIEAGGDRAVLYGATMNGYAQQQQHPDLDAGDWLRACHKKPGQSLPNVLKYMDLPYQRIREYQTFFRRLAHVHKSVHMGFVNFNGLLTEMDRRRPISERKRRWDDLGRLFRGVRENNHGTFLCDISLVIHHKLSFEPVSASLGRPADITYRPESSRPELPGQPKSLIYTVHDLAKPPSGTVLRAFVFEEVVVLADESRRAVVASVSKNDMSAVLPPNPGQQGRRDTHSTDDIEDDDSATHSSDRSSVTRSSSSVTAEGPAGAALRSKLRLVFHDTHQVWHCLVRPGRGCCTRSTFIDCFSQRAETI